MGATYNDAQKRASLKYLAEKTDNIQIRVPKGTKEEWKAYAESKGISLNALIIQLMQEKINTDK
ncbi:MAG: Arc family DNA-binding protein [Clostridia bacterium]